MTAEHRHRLAVLSRIVAAFPAGYAVTALTVAVLSLLLPGDREDGVLATSLGSFLLYAVIIMAVFHARSAARAWAGLIVAAVPLMILLAILTQGEVVR